ncbi:hypothetical protein BBJ28_00008719 [Nothophytophthora sp. Chile5]|nr:hypothetical protein BBJ28_00008719 [Nothophytophthora sp. Chile5]
MTELSFAARLLLSVALTALSLAVWKWLQTPAKPPQQGAKRDKKRSKKRSAKKSAKPDASSSSPPPSSSQERPQKPTTQPQKPTAQTQSSQPLAQMSTAKAAAIADPGESEDSDSDEGLSAAQVLATRKFKPKNLGGSRLARKIQAALPTADAPRFAVSQEVLARFEGGARWLPATVLEVGVSAVLNWVNAPSAATRKTERVTVSNSRIATLCLFALQQVRKGNEYHLKYDDGEIEYRVPAAFIKPRPTATVSEDEGKSQASLLSGQASELRTDVLPASEELSAVAAASSSSESDDDDGWQVVGGLSKRRPPPSAAAEPLVGGLTKRQRESRRKKERQRELKELLRLQAQQGDVDARARMRYVPPPSAPPS